MEAAAGNIAVEAENIVVEMEVENIVEANIAVKSIAVVSIVGRNTVVVNIAVEEGMGMVIPMIVTIGMESGMIIAAITTTRDRC
jgi:hypothetical protein